MNELISAATAFAAGIAVTAAAVAARLRSLRAQRDAAAANLRRELRRSAQTAQTLRQMRQREAVAAAQIVALSYALHDATAQAAEGGGATAVIGADPQALLGRFSRN